MLEGMKTAFTKKLLAICLAAALCAGMLAIGAAADEIEPDYGWYTDGIGTEEEPYVISSAAELMALGKLSQGAVDGVNEESVTFEGKYVSLGADIDLSDVDWTDIDAEGNSISDYRIRMFAGVLDGNGHTISNLTIKCADSSKLYGLGLFNSVNYGTIKNLNIDCVRAKISSLDRFGSLVGAIQGVVDNCHISDVKVTGEAGVDSDTAVTQVGGMIGLLTYGVEGEKSTVKNCSVTDFSVDMTGMLKNTGALIGYNRVGDVMSCKAENVNIKASGNVWWSGGLVGYDYTPDPMASFDNCSVKGVTITAGDSMNLVAGFTSYGYGAKFNGCTVTDVVIKCDGRCYGGTGFISCAYVGTDCVSCSVSGVEIEAGSVGMASGFAGTVNRSYWNSFSDPFALFTSCST